MRRASECGLNPDSADPQRKAHVVAIFRSALPKSPDSAELTLGMAQAKIGLATVAEINDASTLIKSVLVTKPKYAKAHFLLGNPHEAQRKQAGAITEYRTAAELLLETQATP